MESKNQNIKSFEKFEKNYTEKRVFLKPVIDLQNTGAQIKQLRKEKGFSVRDLQDIFGFEYPQAVYAWEQGKNVPTVDNLLVLSKLFDVAMEELIVTRIVEIEIACNEELAKKICDKKCDSCKFQLSA